MKKILVPVDFSSHTGISCKYAAGIASAAAAEVALFHSFFEQIYFSDGGFGTGFETGLMLTDDIIQGFYREKEESLRKLKEELAGMTSGTPGGPVNVSYLIESGNPQVQITAAVRRWRPDLIVMGSAGLGRKGFLSGSVCKHLMGATGTPVLAIPDITVFKGMSKILYVTALESGDTQAIRHLFELLEGFNPLIHCLHLNVGQDGADSTISMDSLKDAPDLKEYGEKLDFKVIACEHPTDCLRTYIAAHDIQLIAFIPHKRNFFRIFTRQDLTKEDLFMTGLPVLAIS